jgi:hypothetical protein
MREKNSPDKSVTRVAHYLEKNAIKIVPETALGLGKATFRFWKIGKGFLDLTEIGALTYNTETEKIEPIPEHCIRRMSGIDGFFENVLEPLKDLLYLTEGDLYAERLKPLRIAMNRLKKLY